ncbi:MAG: hypothetical protein FRX48_02574 [Lasallia pustulata]|uniref:Uncharacterized protein n=1 Tax=Lasallia pustulata TaxID=136370 RepID=A0A5M8PXS9_9LECA|nr:MAG: hypothetical protein FRX48_02574 [Lasallia pustulata]
MTQSTKDDDAEWLNLEDNDMTDSDHTQSGSINGSDTDDDLEWLRRSPNLEDKLDSHVTVQNLDPDEDLLNPRAREAKLQRVQALAVANWAFSALF